MSCKGRQNAITGRMVIKENDMARLLAAENAAQPLHVSSNSGRRLGPHIA